MKKILLIFLLCVFGFKSSNIQAQQADIPEGKYRVYCQLLGVSKFLKPHSVRIIADFGQKRNYWKSGGDMMIVDKEGNKIEFNSMVDAMNYFGRYGWKFVQAYALTMGQQNVYHWLLYKDVSNEEEVKEGIVTKADVK